MGRVEKLKVRCKHSDPVCRECAERRERARVYRVKNRDRELQYQRAWRAKNKDKCAMYARTKAVRNKESIKGTHAKYRAKHRGHGPECHVCARRNAVSRAASLRIMRQKGRAYWNRSNHRRRALATSAFVEDVDISIVAASQCGLCYLCSEPMGSDVSVEHVVPLCSGGKHDRLNVAASHVGCNKRKGTRSLLVAMLVFGANFRPAHKTGAA